MNEWLNGFLSRLSQDYFLGCTEAITSLAIAVNLGPNKEQMQTSWAMAGLTQPPSTASSGSASAEYQGTMPPAVDYWAAMRLLLNPKGSGLPIWSPHSMTDI